MSWKDDLKQAMIDALVKHGAPVSDQPSFYGWREYDWDVAYQRRQGKIKETKRECVARVGIDYAATSYRESCWDEFMGTFYEGDTRVYGVDLDLVLLDGTRLHWRYSGSLSELITAVLEAE